MTFQTKTSPFSELMIRIQSLRRSIDDANRALICGSVANLIDFPEEIEILTGLAQNVPLDRRQQAIIALNALDADINAYTRILGLWQHQARATTPDPLAAFA